MGKSSPKLADPIKTASGQTASNIGTAIAQQQFNNVNQITPDGSLTFQQRGTYKYKDPLSGQTYDLPQYTAVQQYSGMGKKINDSNQKSQLNMANLASTQSDKLNRYLNKDFDISSLGQRPNTDNIRDVNFKDVNPSIIQSNIGDVGNIQRAVYGSSKIPMGIEKVSNLNTNIRDAGNIVRTYGDYESERSRVENALMERLNPRLERDRSDLESRLAQQGIRIGSEAYNSAMDDINRSRNDARLGVIANAGNEQSRMSDLALSRANFSNQAQQQAFGQNAQSAEFSNDALMKQFGINQQQAGFNRDSQQQQFNQNLESGGFNNQAQQQQFNQNLARVGLNNDAFNMRMDATEFNNRNQSLGQQSEIAKLGAIQDSRNQALQEAFAVRNQPINEITALLGSTQVSNPSFVNANSAQIANTDYAGIQNSYDKMRSDNANARNQANSQLMGSIVGSAAPLYKAYKTSDKNIKKDIKKVGKTNDGQSIYSYRYKGESKKAPLTMGLMAQDVEKKDPKSVKTFNGIKMVNYQRALKNA